MDDNLRRIPPNNHNFEIILGSSSKARREILAEMGYEFTIMTADIDEKSIRKETPEELVTALAEAKAEAIMMKLESCNQLKEMSRSTLLITADTMTMGKECLPAISISVRRGSIHTAVVLKNLKQCQDCSSVRRAVPLVGSRSFEVKSHLHLIGIKVVVYQGIIREKPTTAEEARQFIRDYSGGSAEVVGSILVTNLVTGCRKAGWESAEVYFLDIPDEVIDILIEEGITFNVAGGLMLEHPLILPLIDTVVGTADCVMGLSKTLTEKLIQEALVEAMV